MYEASSRGDVSVVKLLLAVVGIDVNPIVTLWSESEDSDDDEGSLQYTPLLTAVEHGHKTVVEMLLAHPHIDVNQADETGRTPLFLASELGREEVVKIEKHTQSAPGELWLEATKMTKRRFAWCLVFGDSPTRDMHFEQCESRANPAAEGVFLHRSQTRGELMIPRLLYNRFC